MAETSWEGGESGEEAWVENVVCSLYYELAEADEATKHGSIRVDLVFMLVWVLWILGLSGKAGYFC